MFVYRKMRIISRIWKLIFFIFQPKNNLKSCNERVRFWQKVSKLVFIIGYNHQYWGWNDCAKYPRLRKYWTCKLSSSFCSNLSEPLYIKYSNLVKNDQKFPADVLDVAVYLSFYRNSEPKRPPFVLGKYIVQAKWYTISSEIFENQAGELFITVICWFNVQKSYMYPIPKIPSVNKYKKPLTHFLI